MRYLPAIKYLIGETCSVSWLLIQWLLLWLNYHVIITILYLVLIFPSLVLKTSSLLPSGISSCIAILRRWFHVKRDQLCDTCTQWFRFSFFSSSNFWGSIVSSWYKCCLNTERTLWWASNSKLIENPTTRTEVRLCNSSQMLDVWKCRKS